MASVVGIELEERPGGAHDAFTHAYVSARLTVALGPRLAEWLGHLNEIFGSLAVGAVLEARMDRHNNAVGREIGIRLSRERRATRQQIAKGVKQALDDGALKLLAVGPDGVATLVGSTPAR